MRWWLVPPDWVQDEVLWREACNEVALYLGDPEPFTKLKQIIRFTSIGNVSFSQNHELNTLVIAGRIERKTDLEMITDRDSCAYKVTPDKVPKTRKRRRKRRRKKQGNTRTKP